MRKNPDIWKNYNPVAYRLKLVQFEDDKRYLGVDLYERRMIPDFNKLDKKLWRERLKDFGKMMIV